MKTLSLTREDIYKGTLLLVNQSHPLNDTLVRQSIALVPIEGHAQVQLASCPAVLFTALVHDCQAQGQIIPVSGYRDRREQQRIYVDSLYEHGDTFTRQFVALPNCSEHQTGLAIDVGQAMDSIDFLCPAFPYEGICQQFRQKAATYGFIQRYSKDKEPVTGIAHEPVSYTHLDVYKRQRRTSMPANACTKRFFSVKFTDI